MKRAVRFKMSSFIAVAVLLAGVGLPALSEGAQAQRRGSAPVRQAPRQLDVVVLAPAGGNATTFAQAYDLVAPGGTIRLRPGVYRTTITINKSVTLLGITENGRIPVLEADQLPVTIAGGIVRIDNVSVRTMQSGRAMWISGGNLTIENARIHAPNSPSSGRRTTTSDDAALAISGGQVLINETDLGPGYSQSVVAYGASNVIIRSSTILGPGPGAFGFGHARLTLDRNVFQTPLSAYAIEVRDNVIYTATNNRFTIADATTWLCYFPGVTGSASGNVDSRGVVFPRIDTCPAS